MSKDELLVKYTNKISNAEDKETATTEVLHEIDGLIYEESKESISNADKKYIIDELYRLLSALLIKKGKDGKIIVLCEKENLSYLTMLKAVSAEVNKRKGK